MRVIIAGGRDFNNYAMLKAWCDYYLKNQTDITVVCGMAAGADLLGKRYAEERGYTVDKYPADWTDLSHPDAIIKLRRDGTRYDAKAGHRRNEKMAQNADCLIAFWNGSSGTGNMIDLGKKYFPLKVKVVKYQ